MSYCSNACGGLSWEMFILADNLQNKGEMKFQNTVGKCWHAQSPSASQTALLRHKNVTRVNIFLSLGYGVKAFLPVSPANTGVPSFQRTVLVCFDTGASSQPVPGQIVLDFFCRFSGRTQINGCLSSHNSAHHSYKSSPEILPALRKTLWE